MNERERRRPEVPRPNEPRSAQPGSSSLNQMRREAAAVQAAADAAIQSVLSGDSEAFNAAMRQSGGQ
jgi:hypothetical protein